MLCISRSSVKQLSLQNVNFPIKMTANDNVWIWSLLGEGVILTGVSPQDDPY